MLQVFAIKSTDPYGVITKRDYLGCKDVKFTLEYKASIFCYSLIAQLVERRTVNSADVQICCSLKIKRSK